MAVKIAKDRRRGGLIELVLLGLVIYAVVAIVQEVL